MREKRGVLLAIVCVLLVELAAVHPADARLSLVPYCWRIPALDARASDAALSHARAQPLTRWKACDHSPHSRDPYEYVAYGPISQSRRGVCRYERRSFSSRVWAKSSELIVEEGHLTTFMAKARSRTCPARGYVSTGLIDTSPRNRGLSETEFLALQNLIRIAAPGRADVKLRPEDIDNIRVHRRIPGVLTEYEAESSIGQVARAHSVFGVMFLTGGGWWMY